MFDITPHRADSFRTSGPLYRLLLAAVCLLSTVGCMSTNLPPIYAHGAAYEPLDEEIDLWHMAREEERLLTTEAALYDDPELDLYLEQLVERLQAPGMAANREVRFRVTVLDDPAFNAFAYPHGSIYVTSGLLAQAETEDQIAGILAHEMTHVENRHMARHERARWNRAVPIAALTFATSIVLAAEEVDAWEDGDYAEAELLGELSHAVFFLGFELADRVSARGYGRRLELEADAGMIAKLEDNGYDVDNVLSFYDRLAHLERFGEEPQPLSHGLGPDAAQRLRALMKSDRSTETVTSQPLLAPSEVALLMPPRPGDELERHLDSGP